MGYCKTRKGGKQPGNVVQEEIFFVFYGIWKRNGPVAFPLWVLQYGSFREKKCGKVGIGKLEKKKVLRIREIEWRVTEMMSWEILFLYFSKYWKGKDQLYFHFEDIYLYVEKNFPQKMWSSWNWMVSSSAPLSFSLSPLPVSANWKELSPPGADEYMTPKNKYARRDERRLPRRHTQTDCPKKETSDRRHGAWNSPPPRSSPQCWDQKKHGEHAVFRRKHWEGGGIWGIEWGRRVVDQNKWDLGEYFMFYWLYFSRFLNKKQWNPWKKKP